MEICSIMLRILLLCVIIASVKGNTENPEQKKEKADHEQQVKTSQNESETKVTQSHETHPDHDQSTKVTTKEQQTTETPSSVHDEQQTARAPESVHKQPTTDVGSDGNQTKAPTVELNPQDVIKSNIISNATERNMNARENRPKFRRYMDLVNKVGVIERYHDQKWERIYPPPMRNETANVTRFIIYENGTKVMRRTKYDYSYDMMNWFHSTRVKVAFHDPETGGAVYKFKFGPRRWVDPYRNKFYNNSNVTYEDVGPSRIGFDFESGTWFRPPPRPGTESSHNGTLTQNRQTYAVINRNAGPGVNIVNSGQRYRPRQPSDRRYYGFSNYRNPYHSIDRKWDQPEGDGTGARPQNYRQDSPYYDERRWDRQRYGRYGDRRYGTGTNTYGDRRSEYYDNERNAYGGRKYVSEYNRKANDELGYRDTYDDRRYDQRYGGTYDGRRYDQGYAVTPGSKRNDPTYADTYDSKRYDPGYADTYNNKRYDPGYGNTYDSKRYDPGYADPPGSNKGYDQGHAITHDSKRYDPGYADTPGTKEYEQDYAVTYGSKRYDQGYTDSYGSKRYDQGYRDTNDGRRRDYPPNDKAYRYDRGNYDGYYGRDTGSRNRPYRPQENFEHGESFENRKWKFAYLDRNKIPEGQQKQEKYFVQEYMDILAKASKHLWKSHRDIRTLLQDNEELKQDGINLRIIPAIVNGSTTILSHLANKITTQMDGNITIHDIVHPIDRDTYNRVINNFHKLLDYVKDYRISTNYNPKMESLRKKLLDYKQYFFLTYNDISHMLGVVQRTMKKYGLPIAEKRMLD